MKISELRSPYKEMALANQVLQGNVEDESKDIEENDKDTGGFDWESTNEGDDFWIDVSDGKLPELTALIRYHYPQIFGKQESTPVEDKGQEEWDYTTDPKFWIRLRMFVLDVQVSDLIGEEEKGMILHNCEKKIKQSL